MKHLPDDIPAAFESLHRSLASGSPLACTAVMAQQIAAYLQLLQDWTTKIDLVSPASPEVLFKRHALDAFAAALMLSTSAPECADEPLMDIGSGAGLPGVIFAVLQPTRSIFLCEPREKRGIFLQEVKRRLGLENIAVLNKRVGDVAAAEAPGLKAMVSRALTPDEDFFRAAGRLFPAESFGVLGFYTSTGVKPVVMDKVLKNLEEFGLAKLIEETVPYSLEEQQKELRLWKRVT